MNIIIIEDEIPALNNLLQMLNDIMSDVKIVATIATVKDGIAFFRGNVNADLILSDIKLQDGLSFEIFSNTHITAPIVFITGHDNYVMEAFTHHGIDYLLKPLEKNALQKALQKYKQLQTHFNNDQKVYSDLTKIATVTDRTRLIVKKGIDNISLKLEDIIMIYTANRVVYVIDEDQKKYIVDKTLSELEQELPDHLFFRANRQYIVNVNFIKGYKTYEKVKLLVDLSVTIPDHLIIVSQENAASFREWMENM